MANPSALFLAERPQDAAGSAVTAALSGTRTLLVEVQALVAPTGFGTPRRTALGLDPSRVALLAAVLEKKVGLDILGCDLFVNVAGGMTLEDPAADLATVAALASSFRDKVIEARTLVLGEVGLAGEVRAVAQAEARLSEAARLGFRRAVVPAGTPGTSRRRPAWRWWGWRRSRRRWRGSVSLPHAPRRLPATSPRVQNVSHGDRRWFTSCLDLLRGEVRPSARGHGQLAVSDAVRVVAHARRRRARAPLRGRGAELALPRRDRARSPDVHVSASTPPSPQPAT